MKLISTIAAVIALIMGASIAQAAQMPKAASGMPTLTGTTMTIPGVKLGKQNAKKAVQVAQRRRRRRARRRRGAAIGAGIALGVIGAIAASEAARARERDARRYRRQCRRWARRCDRGNIRACDRWEDNC